MLDTEGESINALDVYLKLPNNLSYAGTYDGQSFITTWVDAPTFKDDILSFSGIVAGGFDGIVDPFKGEKKFPGTLAYITFNTGAVGTGTIFATSDTKAYLNDGDGTETFLIFTPFDYSIVAGKKFISKLLEDKLPPQSFEITLSQDAESFDGKHFIVFETKDKESGMDYYEIKEGASDFTKGVSPYVLKNQNLGVPIVVKAVDKRGNFTLGSINPDAMNKENNNTRYIIIVLVIILAFVIVRKMFRKNANRY